MAFFNNYSEAKNSVEATEAYFERFKKLFLDNVALKERSNSTLRTENILDTIRNLYENSLNRYENKVYLRKAYFFDPWFSLRNMKASHKTLYGQKIPLSTICKSQYYLVVKETMFIEKERSLPDLTNMLNRASTECINYKNSFIKDEYYADQFIQRIATIQTQTQNVIEWFNFLDKVKE